MKATAYLLSIPGGFYATVGVILLVHWVAPGTLREHAVLKLAGIQLGGTIGISYLVKRWYLNGRRALPRWPAAKALRILAYLFSALGYAMSPTLYLLTLKYV